MLHPHVEYAQEKEKLFKEMKKGEFPEDFEAQFKQEVNINGFLKILMHHNRLATSSFVLKKIIYI